MSKRQAKREIDAMEFAQWRIYYRIEPWGDDWRQAARVAAEVHNGAEIICSHLSANGGVERTPDIKTEAEFMPKFVGEKRKRPKVKSASASEQAAKARYG